MNHLRNFIILFIVFLLIDVPMTWGINGKRFGAMFQAINGTPMKWTTRTIISTVCAYLLMTTGMYLFVLLPELQKEKSQRDIHKAVSKGMLQGLVTTGIYDTTSMATLPGFGTTEALIDTTWGTIMYGIITYLCLSIM